MPATNSNRSYSTAHYGLELNGAPMGFVESFEGGDATGDVVEEPIIAGEPFPRKHLGVTKYEDIVLTCGADMSKPFYDWVADMLEGNDSYQNGALVAYDYNFVEVWRLNFFHALVSEVGFPALDGSSKEAATLCVKLAPEYTRRATTSAGIAVKGGSGGPLTQTTKKTWLRSGFLLNIDGVDCSKVNQIEAITVKQVFTDDLAGVPRDYQRSQVKRKVSNLLMTLADDSRAADFYDWHQSFVIKGNNGQDQEKKGTLKYLSANLQDALFTLQFKNLGIFRLVQLLPSTGNVARLHAEMYCEQVSLTPSLGAVAGRAAQPGTTSGIPISPPASAGQPGVAATGMQIPVALKTRAVPMGRLPNPVSAGSGTPSQGPRNLKPLQQQPATPPRPSTLRFRNLSSTSEIT